MSEHPLKTPPNTIETASAFDNARQRLDAVAEKIALAPEVLAQLRECKRELSVHFPVKMDDGTVKMFAGYRVHHNVTRGPAKAITRCMTVRLPPRRRCGCVKPAPGVMTSPGFCLYR